MYSALLVASGAIFLTYAIYLCYKIIPLIEWSYLKKPWQFLLFTMFLIFAGYAFYLRALIASSGQDLLFSATLFFWAVFTMAVIRAGYQLVDGLKTSQTSIIITKHALESDQSSIDKLRNDLESKNEEVDKILGELYALRNLVGKGGSKQYVSEVKRMNRILNELKLGVDAYRATHISEKKTNA